MIRRNTGSDKNRPLYFFDNKKYGKRQAKSANTISRGTTRVASNAWLISVTSVNDELALKYAGTAFARKGETRRLRQIVVATNRGHFFLMFQTF